MLNGMAMIMILTAELIKKILIKERIFSKPKIVWGKCEG